MATQNEVSRRYPPVNRRLFMIVRGILLFLLRTLAKLHIEGRENLPDEEPMIVVTNHLHYFDVAVGATVPHPMWVLAAEKYERHIFALLLHVAGAIFINRGEPDRSALQQALNVLEDDHTLAIAVEGTRSDTGALAEGKLGAAYLATRSGAPVIPLVMWGTEKVIPAWKRFRRADVHVRFGQPIYFPEGRARTAELQEYTEELMVAIARLLPEEYRGIYRQHPEVRNYQQLADFSGA